ncbi:MAG: indolepyruvate ferredoxin oxidoreductase subunit alpha, partial [Christensenellaceae bacterium]|nr:indolepyruvate ferredoxin oxidoreductase subunit alpha [Christensenellaceae bacterium]
LINTVYNHGSTTVLILDNSITGMTGHQQNPTTGKDIYLNLAEQIDLETLCRACGVKSVVVVDPFKKEECIKALKEETAKDEVSVIIVRRPCALIVNK